MFEIMALKEVGETFLAQRKLSYLSSNSIQSSPSDVFQPFDVQKRLKWPRISAILEIIMMLSPLEQCSRTKVYTRTGNLSVLSPFSAKMSLFKHVFCSFADSRSIFSTDVWRRSSQFREEGKR